ncbi:MAG: AbrB family transcriptional regulator, partial [Pseudomonadota bacterium]
AGDGFEALCFSARIALQGLGVSNGMLVGSFVSALLLSLFYPGMQETPGSITLLQIIIGLSVGASMAGHITWAPHTVWPLATATLVALLFQWGACFGFLRLCRWTKADAALAAYPGAMAAVLELTDRARASSSVSLVHVARLFVIALGASLLITGTNAQHATANTTVASVPSIVVTVSSCRLLGLGLKKLTMPAPYLLASLLISLVFNTFSPLPAFEPPPLLLNLAESLLAIAVMIRLKAINKATVTRHAAPILAVLAIMAVTSAISAYLIFKALGVDFQTNLLGVVPGGIESVAVVALGAGLNVSVIMQMQFTRLIAVHVGPTLYTLWRRLNGDR